MAEHIDREELKKAIDTWDKFYYVPLQGIKRGRNDDYEAFVYLSDILHCIDNIPTADVQPVNQWISVKDRLPDESCECLGIVDGEVTEVSYSPKQKGLICVWSMCDADGFKPLSDDAVTHWMPMPEPPAVQE